MEGGDCYLTPTIFFLAHQTSPSHGKNGEPGSSSEATVAWADEDGRRHPSRRRDRAGHRHEHLGPARDSQEIRQQNHRFPTYQTSRGAHPWLRRGGHRHLAIPGALNSSCYLSFFQIPELWRQ